MLFNSIEFAAFLPIIFLLYWSIGSEKIRIQNIFLLAASYFFYGWWDWRFLSLIVMSSFVDFVLGQAIFNEENKKKRVFYLSLSLLVNLGVLGFFKYFNFFIESFAELISLSGLQPNLSSLNIILPVGISFYTFQTLSYTIDVYKKKLEPTKDIFAFFAFVSFFPQLVAGPIERAQSLLPQFLKKRTFDYNKAVDGSRQMLWGLFKKVVIADNCATHVDYIFSNVDTVSPTMLWFGALLFTFQIYCDFSGYSDIAIGLSRLFGFSLMKNFHYPYISRNITEFWQRWHISLSTWFRDYVYIPLGGGRVSKILHFRNIMTIFIVSGFWHGANWTFIFWGFLHGCYYIPLIFSKKKSLSEYPAYDKLFPSRLEISQILQTFFIVMIAWVFFRAENIGQAFYYISRMFEFKNLGSFAFINTEILMLLIFIGILMLSEWRQRDKEHPLVLINQPLILNWSIYIILSLVIIQEFTGQQSFIYFQF